MTGTYDYGPAGGPYTFNQNLNEPDAKLIIRGFTVGLGGSFAF